LIPGVVQKKGQTYRRFKVKVDGKWKDHYVKLPDPSSPGFAEALAKANGGGKVRTGAVAGTFAALAVEHRKRLAAAKLAVSTRRNKLYYVELIEAEIGTRPVRPMRMPHVFKLRDKFADTPGKANNLIAVLKGMLAQALEYGWITTNPAAGVPLLPIGEHEPWPAEVQEAALAEADPMLRLAIVTGLCGGQRLSDCIRIAHSWHDGRMMRIYEQKKTAVAVAIPMHPLWIAEIASVPKRATTLLYDRSHKPFSGTDRIQERLRRLMRKLGYVDADNQLLYTFHGLRKNACCYLLELGLSDTEVGAILGMTPETVRHYGKRARVLVIAEGAFDRIVGGKILSFGGTAPDSCGNSTTGKQVLSV
jgi:integrase